MDIYSLLESVPTMLRITTINYLMDFGKKMSFEVGEVVFREGDPCQQVYIILSGEANVIKGDSFGNSNVIATAQQGSVFGEMGVFLDLHRSGSIVAKTPLAVLALKNDDFIGALQQFPDLTLRFFKSLSIKLDSVNQRLSNLINAMSMVQLGTYILERGQRQPGPQSYDFHAIMKNTELQRRDIVNTLINYNRLTIIDKLQFGEEDDASFQTDFGKLRRYLQRITLNPGKA